VTASVSGLSIDADARGIGSASEWLGKTGQELGVPAEQVRRLELCLNEVLANIILHGGEAATASPVRLQFEVSSRPHAHEASLTVSDAGIAFNPLAHQQKPRPETLAEAEPGGLGLLMMREFSDDLGYRNREGRNQTTFTVRWNDAA
jgi:anti-sigma regulatory factor (Ser/Thr protein kinase)